jgi:alpha-beta hydrolase superfamily lysophospholipase
MKSSFLHRLVIMLLICTLCVPAFSAAGSRRKGGRIGARVSFTTDDGVVLSGLYVPPQGSSKVFVLLHGLGSNQEEWQPFIGKLIKRGYGILSYDARGHGESIHTKGNADISYESFGPPGNHSPWNKMPSDLDTAVSFLTKTKNIPVKRIGIMGASLGANVALIYAAGHPSIPVVVLLSPGLSYAGLNTAPAIAEYGNRPLAIAVSTGDTYAYQSSCMLYKEIKENKKSTIMYGSDSRHGVQMFNNAFDTQLLKWIGKN